VKGRLQRQKKKEKKEKKETKPILLKAQAPDFYPIPNNLYLKRHSEIRIKHNHYTINT